MVWPQVQLVQQRNKLAVQWNAFPLITSHTVPNGKTWSKLWITHWLVSILRLKVQTFLLINKTDPQTEIILTTLKPAINNITDTINIKTDHINPKSLHSNIRETTPTTMNTTTSNNKNKIFTNICRLFIFVHICRYSFICRYVHWHTTKPPPLSSSSLATPRNFLNTP